MKQGIPQRTAHHLVGSLVGTAQSQEKRLADLTDAEFKAAHPSIDSTIREVLGVEKAVQAYQSYGSSSPTQVRSQIARWREQLQ